MIIMELISVKKLKFLNYFYYQSKIDKITLDSKIWKKKQEEEKGVKVWTEKVSKDRGECLETTSKALPIER